MTAVAGNYASLTADTKARIAFMRLGLGPKPDSRALIGSGADAAYDACLAELNNPAAALIADNDVIVKYGPNWAPFQGHPYPATAANCGAVGVNPMSGNFNLCIFQAEDTARYVKYIQPKVGFLERLVLFWNNHFSTSHKARPWLGHMERTAIRANVLGNFGDMLAAVVTHPAMIAYLDNNTSVGMNSPLAKKNPAFNYRHNENLAREIMELHTLGVNGGYTQGDVTSFAKVLTGWQIANINSTTPGQFVYVPEAHEPGAQTVLGKTYAQPDLAQGKAVLSDLASHPQTAQHIATKLIRHFITDSPSDADVSTLANVFVSNKGNLFAVSKALLELPSAWTEPFARIRKPYFWMVSITRGLGMNATQMVDNTWRYNVFGNYMGHYPWSHITPDGYPDDNDYWMTADALRVRNDISCKVVSTGVGLPRWPGQRPAVLAENLLGTCLTPSLKDKLTASRDDRAAFPLLFMSPEYLWS